MDGRSFDNFIKPISDDHISIVNPERPDAINRKEVELFDMKKDIENKINMMASKDFRQINAVVILVATMLVTTVILTYI